MLEGGHAHRSGGRPLSSMEAHGARIAARLTGSRLKLACGATSSNIR